MKYKIDHKIPIPKREHKGKWTELLSKVKPGDSIYFKTRNEMNSFAQRCMIHKKTVVRRTWNKGFRVWILK